MFGLIQHELREEVVEKVKWNICRDSAEDKLRDLLEWMKAVKRDTVHSVSKLLVQLCKRETDMKCHLISQARLYKFLPTRIMTSFPYVVHVACMM